MTILDNILTAISYLALCFILFLIGKWIYRLFHRKIQVQQELVEKDNFAFAVAHVGYFIGLLLAIVSAVVGPSEGLYYDIIDITIYGLLAIFLLNFSILINDKIILRKFSVHKEIIEDRNVGTGVIEGANAIGTGLIILGAVSGEGGGFLSALVFWIIGQLLLIITAYVYVAITPYDVHDQIEKDNVAVGLGFAGALISIANLIRYGLMTDLFEWEATLASVGIDVLIGLAFLPVVRILTDKILLPGRNLTDELVNQEHPNVGAGLIEAFAYVGGSVLITLCL
ncbi:MAG: DUF350 domain-containing protein [Cyclobacteriaceae bacterium]